MKETFGNSGGEGGFIFLHKNGNSGGWGVLAGIPSVVGVWIFSGTTHLKTADCRLYNFAAVSFHCCLLAVAVLWLFGATLFCSVNS